MAYKTKQAIQTEQQFLYMLAQVVESFPQYTLAQHLVHFQRTKGANKELYNWSDDFLLQRLEAYYDELKGDLVALKLTPQNDD